MPGQRYARQSRGSTGSLAARTSSTRVFKKFNLSADLYLGDFDSTTTENHLYMLNHSKKVLEFPAEKNKTDLEIALDIAVERKCDKINILSDGRAGDLLWKGLDSAGGTVGINCPD